MTLTTLNLTLPDPLDVKGFQRSSLCIDIFVFIRKKHRQTKHYSNTGAKGLILDNIQ